MSKFSSLLMTGAVAIAGASAVLTLGGVAQALQITQTFTQPSTTTDWSQVFTANKFNIAGATLNSVTLNYSSSFTTQLTVTNSSGTASSGTARTEMTLSLQDQFGDIPAGDIPQLDLFSPTFSYNLNGVSPTSISSSALSRSGSGGNTYSSGPILTNWTGSGTANITANTFTQTLVANTGGNTGATQATNASATVTLIFDYTPGSTVPTPEPTTLLGLGAVAALGLFGRKKKSNG